MEGKSLFLGVARGFQFLWALLVMSLIGNVIAEHNGHSSAIVNYTMFCAAFAMLSLLFLIPATIKDSLSVGGMVPFALDTLNNLFWFCGAVALAAELGVHNCSNSYYVNTNKVIRGAKDLKGVCHEAQASDAFLWFGWAAFLASNVITGLQLSGGSGLRTGGIRRGPAMSQV